MADSAAGRFPTPGTPAPRTVLAVFAHPDDESLACGGTLARLADAGVRVVLLCGSRGESGSISDPSLVPDGDLRWEDVPEFHAEIVDALRRYRPDAVITFAEDGLYWHLDHIGVHERTYTAVKSLGADAPPLYYVTMPQGVMREVVEAANAKGGRPPDSSFWGIEPDAFGDSAVPPTFSIDVREWVPRKLAALRCHRTQMGSNNPIAWIDEDEARRWLGVEYFRRSPLDGANDGVLEEFGEPVTTT